MGKQYLDTSQQFLGRGLGGELIPSPGYLHLPVEVLGEGTSQIFTITFALLDLPHANTLLGQNVLQRLRCILDLQCNVLIFNDGLNGPAGGSTTSFRVPL